MSELNLENYRRLNAGEVVQAGDLYDKPLPGEGYGWNARTEWTPVTEHMVGRKAADPSYPAHQQFLRRINTRTGSNDDWTE